MKANKANKGAPFPRKQKASELINDHIEAIIKSGDYVDSNRVYHDLINIFPEVKGNETFRVIQSINKFVDSAIDVYWHTNSIRTFLDLEKYVVQLYNKWKKKTCTCFEDIGIGIFFKNANIVKKFEFYDEHMEKSHLLEVDKKDIISYAVEYMSIRARGPAHQQQQQQLDKDSNKKFNAFLLPKLQRKYHSSRLIGITVDFASLFHQIIPSRSRERTLFNSTKDQLLTNIEKKLTSSFQQVLESSTVRKSKQSGLLSSDDVRCLTENFSSINTPLHDTKSLLPCLSSKLSWHFFLPGGIQDELKITKEDFLSSEDLLQLFEAERPSNELFLFSNSVDPLFDRCIIAVTMHFLRDDLLSKHCNDSDLFALDNGDDSEYVTAKLNTYFEGNLFKGIPDASLKALHKTIQKVVKKRNFLSLEGSSSGDTKASAKLDYNVMLASLQECSYEQLYMRAGMTKAVLV